MPNITLPTTLQNAVVDTFTRTEGSDTVHMQSMVVVDPTDGRALSLGTDISTTNITVLNGDLFSVAVQSYTYFIVQLTGSWSATVTFQGSNDNTNWVSVSALNSTVATYVTSATANGMFYIPTAFKYFRVRATAFTSGPIVGSVIAGTDVAALPPQSYSSVTMAAGTALAADVHLGVRTTSTNAASRLKVISASGTNATSVKASAGRVYGYTFSNTTASFKFVKMHNLATSPTVGTTAVVETIAVPPNGNVSFINQFGVAYATGIALSITGAAADADTTSIAANDVIGALIYA